MDMDLRGITNTELMERFEIETANYAKVVKEYFARMMAGKISPEESDKFNEITQNMAVVMMEGIPLSKDSHLAAGFGEYAKTMMQKIIGGNR